MTTKEKTAMAISIGTEVLNSDRVQTACANDSKIMQSAEELSSLVGLLESMYLEEIRPWSDALPKQTLHAFDTKHDELTRRVIKLEINHNR